MLARARIPPSTPHHLDAVNHEHDDERAARVFAALGDPQSLRLLAHVLEVGECDRTAGRRLEMTARATAARLDRLVAAGVLTRTRPALGSPVYGVADVRTVERLLATVRQLRSHERNA